MHPFALPQRAAASSVTPQVARSEAERLIKGHKNTVFQWSTTTLSCTAKNLYECGIKNKWSKYCENRRGNGTSFGKKVQSWHHRHYAVIGMTSLTLKPLCTHWVEPGRGGGGGWGWGGLPTPPPQGVTCSPMSFPCTAALIMDSLLLLLQMSSPGTAATKLHEGPRRRPQRAWNTSLLTCYLFTLESL